MRGVVLPVCLVALCALASLPAAGARGACPENMAEVLGRFCIDRYEATLISIDERGKVMGKHSPFHPVLPKERVRAESRGGVWPQGYVSMKHALEACTAAGKRLCKDDEWMTACMGKQPTTYPYGDTHIADRCNDKG